MRFIRSGRARRPDQSDRGATAVEYGLLVALIAAALVAALILLAPALGKAFGAAGTDIDGNKAAVGDAVAGGSGGGAGGGAGGNGPGEGDGAGTGDASQRDGWLIAANRYLMCDAVGTATLTVKSEFGPVSVRMMPWEGGDEWTYAASGSATFEIPITYDGDGATFYAFAETAPIIDLDEPGCMHDTNEDWTVPDGEPMRTFDAWDWNTEFPDWAWHHPRAVGSYHNFKCTVGEPVTFTVAGSGPILLQRDWGYDPTEFTTSANGTASLTVTPQSSIYNNVVLHVFGTTKPTLTGTPAGCVQRGTGGDSWTYMEDHPVWMSTFPETYNPGPGNG